MKHITYFVLAVLCGLLVSCLKWGNPENSRLMQQAQQLAEQMPDSALTLLDAVNTFALSNAKRAEYSLLKIQAKRNAGMDLSSETEIFNVRDYFIRKKDPQKASLSCYLAALVSANDPPQAIEYQQEALDYAKIAENKDLQGKILYNMGVLNYNKELYDDAVIRFQQAKKIFHSLGLYKREVSTMISISNSLLLNHQPDSVQYYYQQALNQAYMLEDTALIVNVYNSMGVAYRGQEEFDKATYYTRQAFRLATNDAEKMYIYTNFAYLYHEKGCADSARYYVQLADTLLNKIDNIYTTASLVYLSYQIEQKAGNYQKALEYYELYFKHYSDILENNDRKLLLDMQRKYDFTSKENELNKKKNRAWKFVGAALMFLLALAVSSIYMLRINMKQKLELAKEQKKNTEKQLALEQLEREKIEKTIELENVMQQAQTLQEMHDQKDNEIKTKFLEKIGIIKKIALLTPYLNENALKNRNNELKIITKTHDIVKNLDVQNFIDTANELYPGFTVRLKQSYSELDDREISICCLLLFDFNNQELDLFINHRMKSKLNTVQKWKSTIRRKLGIDSHGDIKTYLLENIVMKKTAHTK